MNKYYPFVYWAQDVNNIFLRVEIKSLVVYFIIFFKNLFFLFFKELPIDCCKWWKTFNISRDGYSFSC